MEYRLATPKDAEIICRFVDDRQTLYREKDVLSFLQREETTAFLAVEEDVAGFAYGYALYRPDGRKDFYLHAIDVADHLQGSGYGTALMRFIDDWRKAGGFRKLFLVTNRCNKSACRCYEKAGGTTASDDDVVYVFE